MSVAEIVIFKLNHDVSVEQLLSAAQGIDSILQKMPGFVSREFFLTTDDRWVDLVRWGTLEDAQRAAQEVMSITKCLEFFKLIDKKSMQFLHATPVE